MALPAAVAQQVEDATKLMSQPPQDGQQAQPTSVPTPQQPAASDPLQQQQASQPATVADPENDTNYWKSRFGVVQGINAKQAADIRDMKAQLEQMQTQMTAMQTPKPTAKTEDESPWRKAVTQDQLDEYSPEFVDMVGNIARSVTQSNPQTQPPAPQPQPVVSPLEKENARLMQVAADHFVGDMNRIVPNWNQINNDERFVQWLKSQVGPTGATALDEIRAAFQAFDAQGCATYFLTWARMVGLNPHQQEQQPQIIEPTPQGGNPPMNPGKPQGRIYTWAEYRQHFDEKVKGQWNHRMNEWTAIKDELEKATREGRVR